MEPIYDFMLRPQILTVLLTVIGTGVGYISKKVRDLSKRSALERIEQKNRIDSENRSRLRVEYLGIFNSQYLSIEEKYNLTRGIYQQYKAIGGNTYVDHLDSKLRSQYNDWVRKGKPHGKNQLKSAPKK